MLSLWLQITISLFITILGLLYYYFTSTFDYWSKKGIKYEKPIPLFGSLYKLMTLQMHPIEYYCSIYNKYKNNNSYVGLYQGRTPSLFINEPNLLKNILIKDFNHFVDHGFKISEEADPLEAKNLFNMEGQKWREMRTKLTPTFTSGRMKAMFPLIQECAVELQKVLKKFATSDDEFEFKDVISRYTTDVIGSVVFGVKCDSLNNPDCTFRKMGKQIVETDFWKGIRTFIVFFVPEIAIRLKMGFLTHEVTEFFRSMVKDVMKQRKNGGNTRKDFMQLLIELQEKGKLMDDEDNEEKIEYKFFKSLTDDDVTAQAMVFFTAGFETSSTLMSFAALELAMNPDVQIKAQEEIERVLENYDGQITYQALQDMNYLECILNETLRKYPPVAGLIRECTKQYKFPDTDLTIDKGVQVLIPVCAMQNDPEYFPDPDKFMPERFSNDEINQNNKFVYMPFGEGPRQCIGNRLALLQSKLGMLAVLEKFKIEPAKRMKYPVEFDPKQFMTAAKDGIWVKLLLRSEE